MPFFFFFYYFIVKILWLGSAAGTALRPKTLIHQPQDKQQSWKAIKAWNPKAVTVVTYLNSLDPQSNALESNLMTEAIFIWTSVVLSTSHISIFIGILESKQEFSRQYQDAVVAGPQTYSTVTARKNLQQPSLTRKVSFRLLKKWTRTRHVPKTKWDISNSALGFRGQVSVFSAGNASSFEGQSQILQSCRET